MQYVIDDTPIIEADVLVKQPPLISSEVLVPIIDRPIEPNSIIIPAPEILSVSSSSIEVSQSFQCDVDYVGGIVCDTDPQATEATFKKNPGTLVQVISGLNIDTDYYIKGVGLPELGNFTYGEGIKVHTLTSPIPDEYQLVEYLQSTGGQLILLNSPLHGDTELYIDYSLNIDKPNSVIFGGREIIPYWLFLTGSSLYRFDYNAQNVFPINLSLNVRRTIEMRINNNIMQCYSNDIISGERELFPNLCCNQISLFDGKTSTTQYLGGSIISLLFAEFKNSRLGYDLKLYPVYRKVDNKPGMYDIVNNVFYTNQGTGEFIVGPDKEWEN